MPTYFALLTRLAQLPWTPFTPDDYMGWAGAGDDAQVARTEGTTWVRSEIDPSPTERLLVFEAYDDETGEMTERYSFHVEEPI